ncbi:thioredoxin-interacting protein-like [Sphaeramia orbicularis]|uniref:thioredoxin-interacting protein-like n=1 Tax=Sphaeramia orbicularis TaxID=375764 RepID=UPI00117CC60B|nr:thioredoxin-interacting protein-like [Sphaeramia orbicularis]
MSSTVKSLKVTYNPINDTNTFRCGDLLTGRVQLEVAKQCDIKSLFIKFKGKAEVLWTERHGQRTVVYHSKNKYFSAKHYFIGEKGDNSTAYKGLLVNIAGDTYSSVVAPGVHVYPFSCRIPVGNMPSSFVGLGEIGKIMYLLETRLSRAMRVDKKDTTQINFVAQPNMTDIPQLMVPQQESTEKKLKFLNSGTVAMGVNIERMGFYQGEDLKVSAFIQNNCSREIKPKYCIYRKHSYFAGAKRRLCTEKLVKEVGKPVPPSTSEKVTQILVIPRHLEPSILNCDIIKAEHRLRVYLDVKYASDPETKFPLVILEAPLFPDEAPPAAAAGFGFEAFGNPDLPQWGPEPQQQPLPSAESHFEDSPPPYTAIYYPTLK